jgi:sugar lactone lactonase YvrE
MMLSFFRRFGLAAVLASFVAGCGGWGASSVAPSTGLNHAMMGPIAKMPTQTRVGNTAASKRLLYVSNLNGPNGQGRPIRTITTGANRPDGIWVDGSGVLYVVNEVSGAPNASITEFHRGQSQPFRTITDGLVIPETVAVDANGTVYVNDRHKDTYNGEIIVYALVACTPRGRSR